MALGLIALLDDIATVLDDVAVLSKVAVKKTAGVVGDDLALNANQVAGVRADRELPVVWAVAKGSLLNKVILVPIALLLSAFASWAITPLLVLGGLFLCFEGAEKVLHKLLHTPKDAQHEANIHAAVLEPSVDMVTLEKDKIKGAVRTDFVLSAEIIVISLGAFAGANMLTQSVSLSLIALGMTVFVYGLVAIIVRLDDVGLSLMHRPGRSPAAQSIGKSIVGFAPWLMRGLALFGTIAMFTVGGGILAHAWHGFGEGLARAGISSPWALMGLEAVLGLVAGLLCVGLLTAARKMKGTFGMFRQR